MAATLATDAVYDAFLGDYAAGRTFQHGHTLRRQSAGGRRGVRVARPARRGAHARRGAAAQGRAAGRRRSRRWPTIRTSATCGSWALMAGVELVADRATGEPFPADERRGYQVCRRTTASGVWLRPLGDVVVVMPPLAIADAELELLGRVLAESIDAECSAARDRLRQIDATVDQIAAVRRQPLLEHARRLAGLARHLLRRAAAGGKSSARAPAPIGTDRASRCQPISDRNSSSAIVSTPSVSASSLSSSQLVRSSRLTRVARDTRRESGTACSTFSSPCLTPVVVRRRVDDAAAGGDDRS